MKVYRDHNIPIEVTLSETFAILLPSIPSAGFEWKADYDIDIIEQIGEQEVTSLSQAIGGEVETKFKFRAKQLGETKIKMKYQRIWETHPFKEKDFTVRARIPKTC